MTNDETRITNQIRNQKFKIHLVRHSDFGVDSDFWFRDSGFPLPIQRHAKANVALEIGGIRIAAVAIGAAAIIRQDDEAAAAEDEIEFAIEGDLAAADLCAGGPEFA